MTPEQFEAIAKLIRAREGSAQSAARLVLIEGKRVKAAAEACAVTSQSVSKAVRRFRDTHALLCTAYPPQAEKSEREA
ncbi:hypothetical protein GPA22_00890 [Aromatoleum toluvorans]|uniref:TrfB transcriptional repressor protein domain-containing protein n=1 Tax=Aromatoleum toluvorans TaxID=92002 RepID=A0ABX1PT35_9RHOO|nr:TrfB-related DNA-binding protein [Aromatoleum toluvorans]NMG42293.1 hypothetical protein [Aromatoleum toluvorans]